MTKPVFFISYSHQDESWKDRLVKYLKVLQIGDILEIWDDLGFALQTEKKFREALACYLLAKNIRIQIKDPNLKITESNIPPKN